MKLGLLIVTLLLSQSVFALWTGEPTLKATVWSYDHTCAKLKMADGKFVDVKKELLQLPVLKSRQTVIEYHASNIPSEGCTSK